MTLGVRKTLLRGLTRAARPDAHRATHALTTPSWSQFRSARRQGDEPLARDTLERLCEVYASPVYTLLRHEGFAPTDAARLAERFFRQLTKQDARRRSDPERAGFREWLGRMLSEFIEDRWLFDESAPLGAADSQRAEMRCAQLDYERAERAYALDPADASEPGCAVFKRAWALALLEHAQARLAEECRAAGNAELYALVRPHLGAPLHACVPDTSRTGLRGGPSRMRAARLRMRFHILIREEIAESLGVHHRSDRVQEELTALRSAFAKTQS